MHTGHALGRDAFLQWDIISALAKLVSDKDCWECSLLYSFKFLYQIFLVYDDHKNCHKIFLTAAHSTGPDTSKSWNFISRNITQWKFGVIEHWHDKLLSFIKISCSCIVKSAGKFLFCNIHCLMNGLYWRNLLNFRIDFLLIL